MTKKATGPACSVLVAGETGVGKSSLINYLVGKDVVKIGVGWPQTSWNDLLVHNWDAKGVRLRVFDSPGIEVNKTDIWRNEIEKIIGSGSVDKASNSCVVIYCVSCGGQRFQKNDAAMINHFKWQGASVVIALTKCDQVSKTIVKKMRDSLPNSMPVVEISSGGALRFGKTKPFGKEKLMAEISKCVGGYRDKHLSKTLCETSKTKPTKSSQARDRATRKTRSRANGEKNSRLGNKPSRQRKDGKRSSRNTSNRKRKS